MVSVLILMIVAVAGARYLFTSDAVLAIQRNRRAALETANGRLEDLKATFTSWPVDANPDYITKNGTSWATWGTYTNQYVTNNGVRMSLLTTLQWLDASSSNCVKATVSVAYRTNQSDQVVLQTLISH